MIIVVIHRIKGFLWENHIKILLQNKLDQELSLIQLFTKRFWLNNLVDQTRDFLLFENKYLLYSHLDSLEIPNNLNKSNLVDNRQYYSRKIENKDSQEKEKSQSRNVNVSLKETSASFLNSFLIQTKKSKSIVCWWPWNLVHQLLTKDHRIQTSNRNRSLLRPLGPHPQQKEDLLHRILRSRPPCELLPNLQPQPSTGWHLATPRSSPNLLRSNPRSEAHLPQTPRKDRNKNGQKSLLIQENQRYENQ